MRRAVFAVVLVGVLVCGLLVCWQHNKREPSQVPAADLPAAAGLAVPRLVPVVRSPDAERPEPDLPTPSRDAGMDGKRSEEATMLEQIRYNLTRNPPAAEALARQAQERFPDSPYSDERDMLLVLAVFNQGIDARARAEAYSYFKRHPNGRYTNDISRLTRTRPR